MSVLQPRLFNDLPPTREETPVHQLNYPTFAGAENTMWHGRSFYPTSPRPQGGWNPEGEDPIHVGTFEAAAHRGLGVHRARRPVRHPGGGFNTYSDDEYRPREELMEAAGTERGTQMLPFRIREDRMRNSPETPVSDAEANIASGYVQEYVKEYAQELMEAGLLGELEGNTWEDDVDQMELEGLLPDPITMGGLYYENKHEDPGSISAVVPEARSLQHWPTEVMQHSDNPAQRRTAEFLLGRGY